MEGKEKEKEEALKNDKKKEKAKASKKKPLSTTIKKKAKKVNKVKQYKIEKITDYKCGPGKKKVITILLIKWEGFTQTTWERLSVINETASGMVKDYIKSKNLMVLKNTK